MPKFSLLAAFLFVLFPALSYAQGAPDAVFVVGGTLDGGSGLPNGVAPPSWDIPGSEPLGQTSISGSTGSNNITLNVSADYEGMTIPGQQSSGVARHSLQIYVRGRATATYSATTSAELSASTGPTRAEYGEVLFTNNTVTINGPATDSISETSEVTKSVSCTGAAGGSLTLPEFPEVQYFKADFAVYDIAAEAKIGGAGSTFQSASSEGTTSVTVTLATDEPQIVVDGPLVGGVPDNNPSAGSFVSFKNSSYDPDDGTNPLDGICDVEWSVLFPDGGLIQPTNPSGVTFLADIPGRYQVTLIVTDGEGDSAEFQNEFYVGDLLAGDPGSGPNAEPEYKLSCGDGEFEASAAKGSGNAKAVSHGTVKTRGYPLSNQLTINTQTRHRASGPTTVFGNAEYSYGMRVEQLTVDGATHFVLISGDGGELDYGPISVSPTPEPGVYGVLTDTGSGYTLTGASYPEMVYAAGNFDYEFNVQGQLTKLVDPAGNEQIVSYNGSNEPTQVLDVSTGRTLTFEYDVPGQVTRVVENGGTAVQHLTYTAGKITKIELKDSLGNTDRYLDITYNAQGLLSTMQRDGDPETLITFSYEFAGDTPLANISYIDGGSSNLTYYQEAGPGATYRTRRINAKGGEELYDFDDDGDLVRVTLEADTPGGNPVVYEFGRNVNHTLSSWTDGITTYTYTYTPLGLVSNVSDNGNSSWTYTYNGVDLLTVTDAVGLLYTLNYNDPNNPHHVTSITDALLHVWDVGYNPQGQLTAITPPTGSQLLPETLTYEENNTDPDYGYLRTYTNGASNVVNYLAYTPLGDVEQIETVPDTGLSDVTSFEYDAQQRITLVTHPDSKTYQLNYTGFELSSVVDEAATNYTYEWCANCGGLEDANLPLGKSINLGRDTDFDVTGFDDGRSNVTSYGYDNARRLKTVTYPDTSVLNYSYDDQGRLDGYTNARGVQTLVGYDPVGRVNLLDVQEPPSEPVEDNISYLYNADDTLQSATHQAGTTSYTYTQRREVDVVTNDFTSFGLMNLQTVDFDYYPDGLIEKITWKDGGTTVFEWNYTYDGAGRVAGVSTNVGASVSYTYDGEGKIKQQTNSNGTNTKYTYNEARNWVTQIQHNLGATPFEQFDIEYDNTANTVGNPTKVTELNGDVTTYGYDALYRLTSDVRTGNFSYSKTYGYDLADNLETLNGVQFASYNAVNEIEESVPGKFFLHDDGNLQIANTGFMPYTVLTWTHLQNKLSTMNAGGQYGQYFYDHEGKRSVLFRGGRFTNDSFYIFAGDLLIGEIWDGVPKYAYVWGQDGIAAIHDFMPNEQPDPLNPPSGTIPVATQTYFPHYGLRGETRTLTNESAVEVRFFAYDGYGSIIGSGGPLPVWQNIINTPALFGGKYGYHFDSNGSGLLLAGARWYSPMLRRWLSRDPIEYDGGDNLYAYSYANPIVYVDPDGTKPRLILESAADDLLGAGAAAAGGHRTRQSIPSVGPLEELGEMIEDYNRGKERMRNNTIRKILDVADACGAWISWAVSDKPEPVDENGELLEAPPTPTEAEKKKAKAHKKRRRKQIQSAEGAQEAADEARAAHPENVADKTDGIAAQRRKEWWQY